MQPRLPPLQCASTLSFPPCEERTVGDQRPVAAPGLADAPGCEAPSNPERELAPPGAPRNTVIPPGPAGLAWGEPSGLPETAFSGALAAAPGAPRKTVVPPSEVVTDTGPSCLGAVLPAVPGSTVVWAWPIWA